MSGLAVALQKIGPYGLASVLQAGSSFVVLPLLILILGTSGYAKYSLLEPLLLVLAQALLLGAHQGLIHAVCKEGKPLKIVLRGLMLGSQIYLIPIVIVIAGFIEYWQESAVIGGLFSLALYLESLNLIFLTAARAVAASWAYLTAVCLRIVVMLGGTSIALAIFGRQSVNVQFVLSLVAGAAFLSMAGLALALRRYSHKIDVKDSSKVSSLKLTRDAVRYGFPIVLASMCQAAISYSDRYVLALFAAPQTVAGYVVAGKLANALNFVSTPVNLWWPTARFAHQKDVDGGMAFFRNAALLLGALYSVAAVILVIASPFLIPLLGQGAPVLLPVAGLLIVATYFSCMQVVLNVGLLSAGHTSKNFWAASSVAIFNVIACFAIVPGHGALGAAAVSAFSAFALLAGLHGLSQQVIKVPQRYGLLTLQALAVCLLVVVVTH